MTWALWWGGLALVGLALATWAYVSLPAGTSMQPLRVRRATHRGPYRWAAHPMYIGNVLFVMGLAGIAGGVWNAVALGTLAEMVMREWAGRETGQKE